MFDLKNFNPQSKMLLVPLSKLNQERETPVDLNNLPVDPAEMAGWECGCFAEDQSGMTEELRAYLASRNLPLAGPKK